MDLSTLAKLQKKTASVARQRHDVSADLISRGFSALLTAQQEDFANRERLVEACELLLEAIRYQRSNPDPYVGVGYMYWLVGEYQESIAYLQEALIFDPQNEDARTLLDQMSQNRPQARPADSSSSQNIPELDDTDPDYDELYDQTETQINRLVQEVSSFSPKDFGVRTERFAIEKMERKYAGLIQKQDQLLADLQFVEKEIDCDELRARLRPFNLFLERCRQILAKSWQQVELQQILNDHNIWIRKELIRIGRGDQLPDDFSQKRFEHLLEDCDALADQLDALEQEGHDVSGLVQSYEQLAAQVNNMQDLLDQY